MNVCTSFCSASRVVTGSNILRKSLMCSKTKRFFFETIQNVGTLTPFFKRDVGRSVGRSDGPKKTCFVSQSSCCRFSTIGHAQFCKFKNCWYTVHLLKYRQKGVPGVSETDCYNYPVWGHVLLISDFQSASRLTYLGAVYTQVKCR